MPGYSTIAVIALAASAGVCSPIVRAHSFAVGLPQAAPSERRQLAEGSKRSIQLVDRVRDGSDFDIFRDRLWHAVRRRDTAFVAGLLPADGIFINDIGPIPVAQLALENARSPFWQSLEKMLAPQSCELEDYPGSQPDSAVWACPNIASALSPQPGVSGAVIPAARPQIAVVGQRVNVRDRPGLGTSVVGRLSNEVVEFDQRAWQELQQTVPEAVEDPIAGWTPVILPNRTHGYVYNRYVYHADGPRALFELVEGQWQLVRVVTGETESTVLPGY